MSVNRNGHRPNLTLIQPQRRAASASAEHEVELVAVSPKGSVWTTAWRGREKHPYDQDWVDTIPLPLPIKAR